MSICFKCSAWSKRFAHFYSGIWWSMVGSPVQRRVQAQETAAVSEASQSLAFRQGWADRIRFVSRSDDLARQSLGSQERLQCLLQRQRFEFFKVRDPQNKSGFDGLFQHRGANRQHAVYYGQRHLCPRRSGC